MPERTEIALTVTRTESAWEVRVHDGSGEFAKVEVPLTEGPDRALEMAVPYMAGLAEPDPLWLLGAVGGP